MFNKMNKMNKMNQKNILRLAWVLCGSAITAAVMFYAIASAAPTSTITNNLFIKGLSSAGSPTLIIDSTGLVATSTGGGSFNATGTPPQILIFNGTSTATSSNAFFFTTSTLTFEVLGLSSSTQVQSPSGTISGLTFVNASGTRGDFSGSLTISGLLRDGQSNKYSTSTGGTAAGSSTFIQYNDSNAFAATSTFTFSSSTQQQNLSHTSSSLVIGTKFTNIGGASTTLTFSSTAATSSWTVPFGVTSIRVGMKGGDGGRANTGGSPISSLGGSATGTIAVTAGTTYYYCVGGAGADGAGTTGGAGGFCGGANGGDSGGNNPGGGGGGMSWFSTTGIFSTSTVLLVAGAGGGQGGASGAEGGSGGGTVGVNGRNSTSNGNGGTGGTQTAVGTGGAGSNNGTAGTEGAGGVAGTVANSGGGGGAGGLMGGGGGAGSATAGGGGGGGGPSFMSSTLTSTSTATGATSTAAAANGTISISYFTTLSSDRASSTYSLAIGGHILSGGNQATTTVCGTLASVNGDDTSGVISVGTGAGTTCTLTFLQSYASVPACIASDQTQVLALKVNTGALTNMVITATSSANISSDVISYICFGH